MTNAKNTGQMPDIKMILVVDDSKIMRNIVKNTFSLLGIPCRYMEAANGKDAWELLRLYPIDILLLDWNMPELSGLDLLRRLRGMDMFKDLPIIMITSEASRYNVVEALKNGATDYIIKPVNERIFKEKIAKYVSGG
jgi:two-component system chemotaxis response regulator CheY